MIKILHGRNYGHLRTQNPQFNFKFHFVSAFNNRAGRKSPNFITEIARVLSSYPHPAEWTIILPKYQQNIGNPNWLDHLTGLEGNYLVCTKEGKLAVGGERRKHFVALAEDLEDLKEEDLKTCVDDAFAIKTSLLKDLLATKNYSVSLSTEMLLDEALFDENKTFLSSWLYYRSQSSSLKNSKMKFIDFEELRQKSLKNTPAVGFDTSQKPNCLVRKKLIEFFPTKSDQLPDIYLQNENQPREVILRHPVKSCKEKKKLLVLVKTSPIASQRTIRDFYRQFFAAFLGDQEYSLVFVIGAKGLSDSSGELKAEIELNDDFLIALFEDSYESLPHKTFATLQYLTGVCKDKFEYLLFIDDDTLLDLERISQFLLSSDSSSPFIRCLPGNYLSLDAAPYTGKYFLFPEMWPVDYKPPKYCNGQCSLWSKTAVTRVFQEALRTDRREFRLEDFFFSGILREKARVHDVKGLKYTNKDGVSAGLCRHFPKNGLADFISKNFEDDGNKTRKLKMKDVNFPNNVFLDAF